RECPVLSWFVPWQTSTPSFRAGTGTDAQPYFRVFNPDSQTEKFDKDLVYIKKWIPELGTTAYPKPMVDHKFARNRAIETYKKALTP
uniref:FAD-binding domain-containing protein n=1 Tax=Algoriphagus sp. TaxID=1872435 RepID=UPI0040482F5A